MRIRGTRVEKWRSTLLVVSHDRTLLNLLPEICELEKHQISYYGGNYEFYKEQKTLMQEALQQRIEEKEKALHTNTVLSPCRGTSEWRMYGASTVRIHFRYGQGMNSAQKQILHASVHTSI